jgi:glycosyltransferase involved in cell wall biosynthesis
MIRSGVSVIIPAFNEADNLGATLESLKEISEIIDEILVVDDGSIDATVEVVKSYGIDPIIMGQNMGKGAAMTEGAKRARGQVLLFLDADLGSSAAEAKKLVEPILKGQADVSVAKFPQATKKGGLGFVKALARWGVKYLGGIDFTSALSGQRAMGQEVFTHIGAFDSGYGAEVGMTIDIARAGFRLMEVDTQMTHRETGRDLAGFLHRGKQFFEIARVILKKLIYR